MLVRLAALAGAGYAAYRAYQSRSQQSGASGQTTTTTSGGAEPDLSPPNPENAVMPDGAEANDGVGARTIGKQ